MGSPLQPPYSLQGASERALLLYNLTINRSKTVMDLIAAAYVGQAVDQSYYHASDDFYPAWYWCNYGTSRLVLMLGVDNEAHSEQVFNAYVGGFATPFSDSFNLYYKNYASAVLASLINNGAPPLNTLIVGHSAGGAAAYSLSQQLWALNSPVALTNVVAFGAPKFLTRAALATYDSFAHSFSCAWALFDDPVPLIPPLVSFFAWTWGVTLGVLQRNRVNSYIPPGVGKIIQSDLTVSDGNIPPGVNVPTVNDFAAWFKIIGTTPTSPHSVLSYSQRAMNAFALSQIPLNPPVPTPVPPTPPPATNAGLTAALRTQRAVYTANEQRQNSQIPAMPEARNFTAERVGNTWKVFFGGVEVAVGPRRKTAEGLARVGNDMIRRLQRQGGVDAINLTQQFQDFMIAATDNTSGIVPTLAPV